MSIDFPILILYPNNIISSRFADYSPGTTGTHSYHLPSEIHLSPHPALLYP